MNAIKRLLFYVGCIVFLITSTASFALETAIFAGGCFWTMQHDFDKVRGVVKTTAGYTGGNVANPTYEQVEAGDTGHYEAVEVEFDPQVISYQDLLNYYWHNIDPTNSDGQFCDTGSQYRSVIFYTDNAEMAIAQQSKQALINSNIFPNVATQILPASTFYPAETYHQEFARKNPVSYNLYRMGCGRDARLSEIWKK